MLHNIENILLLIRLYNRTCYFLGNCKYQTCSYSNWTEWQGEVPEESCTAQVRTKSISQTSHHMQKEENCDGLITVCSLPEKKETRKICKCANCIYLVKQYFYFSRKSTNSLSIECYSDMSNSVGPLFKRLNLVFRIKTGFLNTIGSC